MTTATKLTLTLDTARAAHDIIAKQEWVPGLTGRSPIRLDGTVIVLDSGLGNFELDTANESTVEVPRGFMLDLCDEDARMFRNAVRKASN